MTGGTEVWLISIGHPVESDQDMSTVIMTKDSVDGTISFDTDGPALPEVLYDYCVLKTGVDEVLLIGGRDAVNDPITYSDKV